MPASNNSTKQKQYSNWQRFQIGTWETINPPMPDTSNPELLEWYDRQESHDKAGYLYWQLKGGLEWIRCRLVTL